MAQRAQAIAPAQWVFKGGGVVGAELGHHLASGVHHRQPKSTGAQVNAQA
jgi:hypothetical protein